MQTQVQHTHLAVCSTQSSTKGWAHRGATSNEGGAPAPAGQLASFGEAGSKTSPQAKKYAPVSIVYIYVISQPLQTRVGV
jgi:hypothetical protein